jgi:hypothetical protein
MHVHLHFLLVFRPQFPEEPIPRRFATVQEILEFFVLPLFERRDELELLRLVDDFVKPFQEKCFFLSIYSLE